MALIGINDSGWAPKADRKPSALEQIAMGVDVASKVLGAGIGAYKTFKVDKPLAESEMAKNYAMAAKTPAENMSDSDKAIVQSYSKNYRLSASPADKSVAIYLPDSKKTFYGMLDEKEDKSKAFDSEKKVRDDFKNDDSVKAFRTIQGAAEGVFHSFRKKDYDTVDPARDIALLYNFIKILDPNSSVREGEIELSQSAAPLASVMLQKYRHIKEGGVLPTDLRKSIVKQVGENYSIRLNDFDRIADFHRTNAKAYDVNPERVIFPVNKLDFAKIIDATDAVKDQFADPEKERRYQEYRKNNP